MSNLEQLANFHETDNAPLPRCVVGFDGFVDHIINVVDTRTSVDTFTSVDTIEAFGQRITAAAGRNCNIELVERSIKLGGNGPIMANALLSQGHGVSYIGTIGEDSIEDPFQDMCSHCDAVYPLAQSGKTDALEFHDGKVLLGKLTSLHNITFETLKQRVGLEALTTTLDKAQLLATVNWTMLPHMTEIWRGIIGEVLPALSKCDRLLFVDLADPSKRLKEDLADALETLKHFSPAYKVVLGLNHSEAEQVAQVLGITHEGVNLATLASTLRDRLRFEVVMLHTKSQVAAATESETATLTVPVCKQPKLATGAGDNFNAGFVSGWLRRHNLDDALATGIATAGYYVRNGRSPSQGELATFLREWDRGHLDLPKQNRVTI